MSQGADRRSKWRVLRGRTSKEALRAWLPASGARTGWDPAWPGLAGILGFGELSLFQGSPSQNVPLPPAGLGFQTLARILMVAAAS